MNAAVTYMRAMERRGIDVNIFCRHLRFHFSIGANFFMEIAKLRSLKMVWAQIVKNCGGDEEAQKINLYVSTSTFCCVRQHNPSLRLLAVWTACMSNLSIIAFVPVMYFPAVLPVISRSWNSMNSTLFSRSILPAAAGILNR